MKLRVRVAPVGDALGGPTTLAGESALLPSGSLATVTIGGLSSGTNYHWDAQAVDSLNAASPFAPYGGNLDPGDKDFGANTAGTTEPAIPAGPTQHDEAASPPAPSGFIDQDTQMVFKATLSDADGQSIQLQLELRPLASPLVGTATHASLFVGSGLEAEIIVAGLAVGAYHWQVRAIDSGSNSTSWTVFAPAEPHFTLNAQPATPAALAQFKLDGITPIGLGATTDQNAILVRGDVADPEANLCQLQVEVKPVTAGFTGTGLVTGPLVGSGSTASVTVPGLANSDYQWRVRTLDSNGGASGWLSFGANADNPPANPADIDVTVFVNTPPSPPAALGQFKSNDTTALPTGGTTDETILVCKGTVTDVDSGQTLRLQLEIRPVGAPFSGMAGAGETIDNVTFFEGTPVAISAVASVSATGLGDAMSYHWQVRALDASGAASAWRSFGGNTDPSGIDITVSLPALNVPPNPPADLAQFKADGLSPLPTGATTDENVLAFAGTVSDPDGNPSKLQIEIQSVGTPFSGAVSGESGFVPSGSTASVRIPGIPDGPYHWQARVVDASGGVSAAASYGSNPETDADFTVDTSTNTPPPSPSGLAQVRLDGITAIPAGGTTNETGVVFRGAVSDPDPGQSLKLQVEVQPVGTGFSDTPTAEGGFVASGGQASATVPGLAAGGYHWQARVVDSAGASSGWVSLGNSPDFTIAPASNTPPGDPTGLAQLKTDGVTPILAVGTTNENTVIFRGMVSDPDDETVKLRVELKAGGVAFDGLTGLFEGPFVSSGTLASVTVGGLADGSYQWRAWTVDPVGAASGPVAFGGPADFTVGTLFNMAPLAPSGANQFRNDGIALAVGGSTNEATILITSFVSDPDAGGVLQLKVELRPAGVPFTAVPTAASPSVANGSSATVVHGGLADGTDYHWQAWVEDSNGVPGPPVAFGANPDPGGVDFTKVPNTAPAVPAAIGQSDDSTPTVPIAIGDRTDGTTVSFEGQVTDPDGDAVRLQVEVRPTGVAFTGAAMATTPPVPSGGTAQVTFEGLLDGTSYHWRARTIDSSGAPSGWVSFGGNPESDADFRVDLSAQPPPMHRRSGYGCGLLGLDLLLPVLLLLYRRHSRPHNLARRGARELVRRPSDEGGQRKTTQRGFPLFFASAKPAARSL